MRNEAWFLADAGISPKTVEFPKQLGHEATHVRTVGLQRASDAQVVERARADGGIVLSFDLDFGDLLALGVVKKPNAILFRLADERADSVNAPLSTILNERITDLESGALIFVGDTRHRVSKAADPPGVSGLRFFASTSFLGEAEGDRGPSADPSVIS